jgi:hypothetical protein
MRLFAILTKSFIRYFRMECKGKKAFSFSKIYFDDYLQNTQANELIFKYLS